MKKGMSMLDWTAVILLVVGGINWGSVALFNLDLVAFLFGPMTILSRIVYGLVGLSALYLAFVPDKVVCSTREYSRA